MQTVKRYGYSILIGRNELVGQVFFSEFNQKYMSVSLKTKDNKEMLRQTAL
jgi:hypothetical protein